MTSHAIHGSPNAELSLSSACSTTKHVQRGWQYNGKLGLGMGPPNSRVHRCPLTIILSTNKLCCEKHRKHGR